ncbi:MAG: hypothetical protein ACRD3Q_10030 [Terriglobales bacterium]
MELEEKVIEFAADTQKLLDQVLPGIRTVKAESREQRFIVRADPDWLPLTVKGQHLADLRISFYCGADSTGVYLAVAESYFVLKSKLAKAPLVRLDYLRDMRTAPACHWQVHAERGAFSHLLANAQTKAPHDLSSLHFPVGGARHRPCLEDFLQFLFCECGIDPKEGWKNSIKAGREKWRRLQTSALVRDAPMEAARVLEKLGYTVQPPKNGHKEANLAALQRW